MRKVSVLLTIVSLVALLVIGCSTSNDVFAPDTHLSFAPVVIPAGATIQTVTFNIYCSNPNYQMIDLYRISSDWDETTVTYNNFGNAYNATVIGSFTADSYAWYEVDITSLFLEWADGTYPNYGIFLKQDTETISVAVFNSREATTNHAFIEVCYELNSEIICEQSEVIEDSHISELNPDQNYGSSPTLNVALRNEGISKQTLLKFEIAMSPPEEEGCSHTIGYWKTHAGFGPQANEVSQYLPISLGNFIVSDSQIALNVLSQRVYGHSSNGITKLMAQLLGAKLSISDGASGAAIASEITEADVLLTTHSWTDWDSMSQSDKQTVNNLKDMFDKFNNGYIGPGHCDEFKKSHDYCNEIDGSHRSDCDNYSSGHNNDDDDCGGGKKKDKDKKKRGRRGGGGH